MVQCCQRGLCGLENLASAGQPVHSVLILLLHQSSLTEAVAKVANTPDWFSSTSSTGAAPTL